MSSHAPKVNPNSTAVDGAAADVIDFLVKRPMPLIRGAADPEASNFLAAHALDRLFSGAHSPQGAMAGLWLAAGDWDRAHQIAQDLNTPEGRYWHGIIHRMEPDAFNAKYWFRQIGRHPILSGLATTAKSIDIAAGSALGLDEDRWSAERFVDICVRATGTALEQPARDVQHAEWLLLLSHCARSSVH